MRARAADVAETEDATASLLDRQALLETIVTDLQWSMLNAGTISCMLTACSRAGVTWTLYHWRHLLQDQAETIRLGLRFHDEIGISAATAERIEKFYGDLADAKRQSVALFAVSGAYTRTQRDETSSQSEKWRRLAEGAVNVLRVTEDETRRQLGDVYTENGRIIGQFLREVCAGDTRRVNALGEITLPALAQRRRSPRRTVSLPCRIVIAGLAVNAVLRDVSRNGLGVSCRHSLAVRQKVLLELHGRPALHAEVIWCKDGQAGLTLATPLHSNDPLLALIR
ncbi:MAG: PilZ domain-containing protein [Hyphomicrobium sp.]